MSNFKPYDSEQLFLLPPSMLEWLPGDHVVWFIREAVQILDLTALFRAYRHTPAGRPAYSPRMLTAVWAYAHMVGIRSSRKLERALHENIAFRVLSGNQHPDLWTLNAFRTTRRKALGDLLVQTVRLARKLGLAPMKQVAVDGTRIQANASKHSAMSYERMVEKEKALHEEVSQYLDACDEADERENELYGPRGSGRLPDDLKEPMRRLEAIRAAKAALEQEARDRSRAEQDGRRAQAEAERRDFHPRIAPELAKPDAKAQRNFTDPDSRIMTKKGKDVTQAYNAQAAVDAETQIILAADLTNVASDCPHLLPMLDQVQSNTQSTPEELTADAGYFSEHNICQLEERFQTCDVLIPPDRQKHSPSGKTTGLQATSDSPRDDGPTKTRSTRASAVRQRMRDKMCAPYSQERYKLRRCSVEPVFGQIKGARGLRQFLHRGLYKVRDMWRFECAVHNLLKIFTQRKKLSAVSSR